MYICICIYIDIHVFVRIHTRTFYGLIAMQKSAMYIYIGHVCIYIHMYVCICIHIHTCVCVYTRTFSILVAMPKSATFATISPSRNTLRPIHQSHHAYERVMSHISVCRLIHDTLVYTCDMTHFSVLNVLFIHNTDAGNRTQT